MNKEQAPIKQIRSSIAGALMAAAIIGCTTFNPGAENPTLTPTPIVESTERYPEIELYYPSLSAFAIREAGLVDTERSSTKWFNLSLKNFDADSAKKAIEYFEKLPSNITYLEYKSPSPNVYLPLFIETKPRENRVVFLIPQQAPKPAWGEDVFWTAATTGIFLDGPYVSFVRVYDIQQAIPASKVFTTTERAANKALYVELCQSTIRIRSTTIQMAELGQEIFCNSLGAAFALRQYGLTYNQYAQWAKDTRISANPQAPSFPLYVLTEPDYQQIPNVGITIKNYSSVN